MTNSDMAALAAHHEAEIALWVERMAQEKQDVAEYIAAQDDRFVVHTDTEGGFIIGWGVWDTVNQLYIRRDWHRHGWDSTSARNLAARLNAAGDACTDCGAPCPIPEAGEPYCEDCLTAAIPDDVRAMRGVRS